MNVLLHHRFTIWIGAALMIAASLGLALFVILFGMHDHAEAAYRHAPGKLITIYDRGTTKVVVSKDQTIGQVLKDEKIELDAHDTVEPSVSTKMVASSYNVNIYRSRPVLVVDGATKLKVMTPYQTAPQIAKDAGISLYPEDTATVTPITGGTMVAEGAGLEMVVHRATLLNLELYGSTTPIRTQGKTVGDMLKEKGIKLGKQDHVTPTVATPITAGMNVKVWREGKQTVTVQEAVPFQSQTIQSGDYPLGYKSVQTPGQDGTANVTYEIDIEGGSVVSKVKIASIVTKQPITEVAVLGVKLSGGNYSAQSEAIMAAAGVSPGEYQYAAYIVGHEDGSWCPTRWQGERGCPSDYVPQPPGYGPGYGLCQATPGSKMATAGSDWTTNPITQMKWCTSYAVSRYGSWYNAYVHWVKVHSW